MTDCHMDVDLTPSSSGGSISASSSAPQKLNITAHTLDVVNHRMETCCKNRFYQARIQFSLDLEGWQMLISDVLSDLLDALEKTDMKDGFINSADAKPIVLGLDNKGLEELKPMLRNGVETNNWTTLIQHPKLRKRKMPGVALGVPVKYKDAVIRAWSFEYLGSAHEVLLKAIDDLHALPPERNYAKNIPIAQSSGTGKSKTVDKVAMERILFPICLREDIGKNYFAYPPTDKAVRNHLDLAPGTADEASCKEYIRSFLSSLFQSARLQAGELWPQVGEVLYADMVKAFYNFFADPQKRNQFYETVVANAKRPCEDLWTSFTRLRTTLKQRCCNWPDHSACPLLISIDEVHVLYTPRRVDNGSDYTLYSRLKSVLNEGIKYDFAVICLSTASHVSSPAPSKEIAPSLRERQNERTLPAPFTELPFDVYMATDPLVPGQETLTSVGSLEFTAKFGRPLFYASYLSRKGHDEADLVEGITRTVREKLSGRTWPPDVPAVLDASSIAILSARLLLDLSPATTNANRYEQELVRNHLRILYSVHSDRETIVTGSSPEPLIAEASAQFMHFRLEPDNTPYLQYWDLLMKFVDHGLAAQGAIGELIGRALSISAMDRAINGLTEVCELKYQTPVRVTDYYKALLTTEAWEILRLSIPANRARLSEKSAKKTFEDAFRDAYFHFSHYGKANDSSPMCDTYAWALWLRGTAVACQLNQELTDRMAPIYFSSLGNVSPITISVNLDQDKTSQSVNPANVAIQSAEDLSVFSHGNKLPYIAAVHCYSLTENEGITVMMPHSHDLRAPSMDMAAPRYQIDFRGLSPYGNITDQVRTVIRKMIDRSKNAVFNDHTREYGVPTLRRMLPVLTRGAAPTEWFGGFDKANAWNASVKARRLCSERI